MNTMVAARVPIEVKEQGNSMLQSIGSNPTELINKAYAFVLKYGTLPGETPDETDKHIVRTVTPKMMDSLRETYESMSLPLEAVWQNKSFRELRDELEEDRFARFA